MDEESPYDCTLLDCFEGFYCGPYSGCISFEEPEPTKETTTEEKSQETTESSTEINSNTLEETTTEETLIAGITGGVIGVNTEFFSNNKFLKYFFR